MIFARIASAAPAAERAQHGGLGQNQPRVVRLVRGLVLTLRDEPYVMAAIAAGSSLPRILLRHILPNTIAPLIVQGTFIAAAAARPWR